MPRALARLLTPFVLTTSGMWGCSHERPPKELFFVGTSDERRSEGLYVFKFDRGTEQLKHLQTVSDRRGPNFQAIDPGGRFLYSVSDEPFSKESNHGTISAYRIDRETGELTLINEQSVGDRGPVHVSVDPQGRFAYVSMYGPGSLSVLGINEDGSLTQVLDLVQHERSGAHHERSQRGPRMHSIIPSADGRFIYASDLGIDKIKIYEVDSSSGQLTPAETPYVESTPGSGPRHLAIHPDGDFAWSIEELTFTVAGYGVDRTTGALQQIQRKVLVPEGTDTSGYMSAADIHTSSDGRFLYASVRGADILSIYEIDRSTGMLSVVGYVPTRGEHPRNFGVDRKGEYVFVANRDDNNVVLFRRNESTGELHQIGLEVQVPGAVCVTHLILIGDS